MFFRTFRAKITLLHSTCSYDRTADLLGGPGWRFCGGPGGAILGCGAVALRNQGRIVRRLALWMERDPIP